jgi:very-short-patch-repair endonuclease
MLGVKILRFTNNEVFTDINKVVKEILKCIEVFEPPLGGRGK